MNKIIYDHNKKLNRRVSIVMASYKIFLKIAKSLGFDVCLRVGSETLELYFNNDYPDLILVDKYFSNMPKRKGEK